MKLVGKTGVWLGVTIALAAIAFAGGQDEGPSKAEKILNANCLSCHDLRRVQTQALDAEGWTKIVNAMVDKGAKVQKDDIQLLANYLEDNFGPLPDGPGKAIVLEKCTVCHDLKRVRQHLATPEEWADTLSAMGNEGLMLDDDEFATVLKYLARNFRN
jgi:hypothetical protein